MKLKKLSNRIKRRRYAKAKEIGLTEKALDHLDYTLDEHLSLGANEYRHAYYNFERPPVIDIEFILVNTSKSDSKYVELFLIYEGGDREKIYPVIVNGWELQSTSQLLKAF